jgi:hypothetical protein
LLAISFCRFASIDANPRLLLPVPDIRASISWGHVNSGSRIPNSFYP